MGRILNAGLVLLLAVAMAFGFITKSYADDTSEAILKILIKKGVITQEEVNEMKAEIAKEKPAAPKELEERIVKLEEDVKKVDLSNALSKLKMKGRFAAGYFDSGKAGSFPSGSFEVPEAKLQFSFEPDKTNTVVMRFNVNNATAQSPLLDYLYLQSKDFLPFLKDTPFSLSSRLGRFKLGFGEETWSNNMAEGILPSNSAGNVGLNDEGLELSGKIDFAKMGLEPVKPLGWVVSVSDGNSGVGSDPSASKAVMTKLHYTPVKPLYLSATYYDSGSLKSSAAEMSIAGLTARPSSAVGDWKRKVWEVDARYDFGKGKKPLDPIVFSDSKAIMRLSYGEFHDISNIGRSGNFGYIDGIYNLTKKYYAAARYSFIDLDGDVTASLNSVTANRHDRYSLGGGYRVSDNTILKLSYDWNKESGNNTEDTDNNLLSAIVATQF